MIQTWSCRICRSTRKIFPTTYFMDREDQPNKQEDPPHYALIHPQKLCYNVITQMIVRMIMRTNNRVRYQRNETDVAPKGSG